jgi:hypothetical protein
MVRSLQTAEFAHGDLQHGNVLVDDSGHLRLVDFDCAWLNGFDASSAPSESGHRNYQRTDTSWGRWMDTFPGLVVHTSLLALAKKPSLWEEMHNGENLIFESKDFVPPYNGRVWREIDVLQDQQLMKAATRLRQCCDPSWSADGGLESILGQQWWEQTKGVPAVKVEAPFVVPSLALPKQKTLRDKAGPPVNPEVAIRNALAADQLRMQERSRQSVKSAQSRSQQGASWWGGAAQPSPTSVSPTQPPTRRQWREYEKWALALAIIALMGVIGLVIYVLASDHTSASASSSGYLSVADEFSTGSLSSEVGTCDSSSSLSGLRITSYDIEALSCNGGSTPYYFQFQKYSGATRDSWVASARSVYSLSLYNNRSCYDMYTATKSGKNYVFYVYANKSLVGIVSANSSTSLEDIVGQNFQSIKSGC